MTDVVAGEEVCPSWAPALYVSSGVALGCVAAAAAVVIACRCCLRLLLCSCRGFNNSISHTVSSCHSSSTLAFETNSGYMGAASCMILSSWGSAWGTWRAGLGVCTSGIDHPSGVIKNIVPIVMAGVLGIYGLIVAVIITQSVTPPNGDATNAYSAYNGYTHVRDDCCCVVCGD